MNLVRAMKRSILSIGCELLPPVHPLPVMTETTRLSVARQYSQPLAHIS